MDRERSEGRIRRTGRSGAGGVVIGALIVTVGLVLLLDNLGIVDAQDVWRFWPVALIAIGVARIAECQRPAALVWGGVMTIVGALLLLRNLDLLRVHFEALWPLALIAFGVSMLLRSVSSRQSGDGTSTNSDSTVSLWAIFGGSKRRIDSPDFRGGDVLAIFGGFHVDLRGAQMPAQRVTMDVNSIFGGCEIIVPDTWRVNLKGMGVFGGFEDKTMPPRTDLAVNAPELIVTGVAIFGGVGVRN